MSVTRISSIAAIAMCQTLINQIEIGAGVATIGIYDGAMPADLETPIVAQNELVILELPSPAFANALASGTGGTAVINTVPAVAATLSGTATFARLFNKNGDAVLDVDVSNADGNGALKLSSVTVVADVNVSVVSLTITQRKA